jgi:iron(III) transport system substrate-binding protein
MSLSRRQGLGLLAGLGLVARYGPARAAKPYNPPDALLEGARKEGELNLYSSTFPEMQAEVIKQFNRRFPFVRVNYVRASGGQMYTRLRSEAANNKLDADTIEHSDRAQSKSLEHLFADYAPPNAADYRPETLVSPKLWPNQTTCWGLAWNSELVKNPPKSWMDLCKPEYGGGIMGQVIAASGGTTWTRIMFERLVLGGDYWARQAAVKPKLFPSGAPLSDAIVRGEVLLAPLLTNIVVPKKKEGAPIDTIFAPEGIPIIPFGSGVAKAARHPNAARLWMDWTLSDEGQIQLIRDQGNMTSLKNPPIPLEGYDPAAHSPWTPEFGQFETLHDTWQEEWNKIYGYRQ